MNYTEPMRLGPRRTYLFEVFTPRHQTVHALEALAQTGAVELDVAPRINAGLDVRTTVDAIHEFDRLAGQYRDYLPAHERRPHALDAAPDQAARQAMAVLQRWIADIVPILERLRLVEAERDNLLLLQEYLASFANTHKDLSLLSHPGELLYTGLYACPHEQSLDGALTHVFKEVLTGLRHRFLILVGLPESAPEIESAIRQGTCYRVDVPVWLAPQNADWPSQVSARLHVLAHDGATWRRALEPLRHDPDLRVALGDIALLKWYTQQAAALSMDEKYCHITGWTSYSAPAQLEDALRAQGIHGFARFLRVPTILPAPVKTLDTWWARPFQVFISMYGTPGEGEVDPSMVLAFIVPLLFGYMFPDVGHGLLLVVVSGVLYQRWPEGRFLIPCGLSAMLFGLVFGDVFGFDDVLPPLWLKPLEHPLEVLLAPLLVGVGLILLGLVFSAIEFHWRGQFRVWLLTDAALLALYIGGLAALFHPSGLYLAAGALVWFLVGNVFLQRGQPLRAIGSTLARLLGGVFQLGVNTLSFLRVGAFALAHAAISSALLQVAGLMPDRVSYWLVLILAQALAVTLETLVVFVQTTRLVFFEFYTRFLRAEGRVFKPLHLPQDHDREPV
jgi:V/A-type H+/Na+-transporting ATPase subunit I